MIIIIIITINVIARVVETSLEMVENGGKDKQWLKTDPRWGFLSGLCCVPVVVFIYTHFNVYRQSNVPNGIHTDWRRTSPSACPITTLTLKNPKGVQGQHILTHNTSHTAAWSVHLCVWTWRPKYPIASFLEASGTSISAHYAKFTLHNLFGNLELLTRSQAIRSFTWRNPWWVCQVSKLRFAREKHTRSDTGCPSETSASGSFCSDLQIKQGRKSSHVCWCC